MNTLPKKILFASLALLVQGSVYAYDYSYNDDTDETGSFYAGVGAGLIAGGDARDMCDALDISCLSYKAYAGYRPSDSWAIEGGYHHLFQGRSTASSNSKIEGSALSLSVLGLMPIKDNIEGFAKLGFAAWEAKVNGATASDGSDVLLGGGAQMKLSENLGLRGEIEYIGGDLDSTSLGASVSYSTW